MLTSVTAVLGFAVFLACAGIGLWTEFQNGVQSQELKQEKEISDERTRQLDIAARPDAGIDAVLDRMSRGSL
jgi:hypothetical protein